jgi:16S rRNA pseudouridine516 synthase
MPLIRLDKLLSGQGYGSRTEIKNLLKQSSVMINGKVIRIADYKTDPEQDDIFICGKQINYNKFVYYMLNKPQGVVCASNDPKQCTVLDLMPKEMRRPGLFPAGRLDKDTEGLVIITDDGMFAHEILSPKKHVDKKYFAILNRPVEERYIELFEKGLTLDDGYECLPSKLEIIKNCENAQVFVTLREGKYHQIKRMFLSFNTIVLYLKRISIGGLFLDDMLKIGDIRQLDESEIALICNLL